VSFHFRSAGDLGLAYRERRATPSEVASRALDAAAALDRRTPPLRTFLALDEADVRAQAERSSARWAAGVPLGPLDGVPVAVKDEFDVIGYPTTCGTSFLGRVAATRDALVVSRLREAGAVLFGKTNMHELGMAPSGLNPHHGTARNPYDPGRDTGGSSSGSAAAVASGVVPIALGNDGGGSLRVPASHCGVASIKGTFGRVPTDGVSVLCWSLEHSGPIGATVDDVVAAFRVITGEEMILPEVGGDHRPLVIGFCPAWWAMATPEVARIAQRAVDALVAEGATLRDVSLPHLHLTLPVGFAVFGVEGAASVAPHLDAGKPMSPSVRLSFDLARGIPATTFVQAQRARALIVRDFDAALEDVDVLITPTTAMTAPRYRDAAFASGEVDDATMSAMVAFTMPLNLTGLPAAQVPCGHDEEGMPVGLQVIARRGADALALAVAAEVERSAERRKPAVWTDLLP
jgi:Asp-tRNA(Asn)/Glu-tRNA(Gln) amidotransferase A subunit family amidase